MKQLDLRSVTLLVMATEPNLALDAVQLQRTLFLLAAGNGADTPTAYGFRPSPQGPVSADLYIAVSDLVASGSMWAIASAFPTYIATARGYKRGAAIRESLPPRLCGGVDALVGVVKEVNFLTMAALIKEQYPAFFMEGASDGD